MNFRTCNYEKYILDANVNKQYNCAQGMHFLMTLCAAAICNGGKAVVTVADKLVAGFESPASKWSQLSDSCVILWAGEHPDITKFVNKVKSSIQDTHPTTEDIAKAVSVVFQEDRKRQNEIKFLRSIGMTFESFYNKHKNNMPLALADKIQDSLWNASLGLILIVAGVDNGEGHLYLVPDPGVPHAYDQIEFSVI